MFIDNPLTIMLLSLIAGFYFEKFIYMGKSKLKCQLRHYMCYTDITRPYRSTVIVVLFLNPADMCKLDQ